MAEPVLFPRKQRARSYERILEAMLLANGELGYERVTVKDVLDRAEVSRATFYKHFAGKEQCFDRAHGEACDWLYKRLIDAAKGGGSWREGLRAALAELLDFGDDHPLVAKAMIVEVHSAGPGALAQREAVMKRFSLALDSARREIPPSQAPPVTSTFMVGAIDTLLATRLMDADAVSAAELLPELLHFVVRQYFGEEAAGLTWS